MATTFQTIPTMDPSESAFVFTMDDNLVLPSNLPVVGTKWSDWELGQRDREIDREWKDYVFVDTTSAAPGRRAFVFGKLKSTAQAEVPFESYMDNEFYRWPTVVRKREVLSIVEVYSGFTSTDNNINRFFTKPSAEVDSLIKVERFQNAVPWEAKVMRHRKPITDDLGDFIKDCLHPEIRISVPYSSSSGRAVFYFNPRMGSRVDLHYPATNFTDWAPFVLRDSQKQVNGMWVREKVTIYPPVNGSNTGKSKLYSGIENG